MSEVLPEFVFATGLGLFGLSTFTAETRIKKIGIRKVLEQVNKRFLQLVAIACMIAIQIAWWIMYDWLRNYEYRITISWWIFLIAGISAILIALLTITF